MTLQERNLRLNELNQKCLKCIEDLIKRGYNSTNPKSCLSFCPTGQEIHKLDDPKWDAQDWNSSKLEGLYHN